MGQKTNPLCFRLGISQSHHSVWFEEPKKYSTGIQEDKKIRYFFKNYIESRINERVKIAIKEYLKQQAKLKNKYDRIFPPLGFEGIIRIEIKKKRILKTKKKSIQIIIYIGLIPPFFLKEDTKKDFENNLKKQEFYSRYLNNFHYEFKIAERPYSQPNLLAEFIALQLKNRIPFKKAINHAIDLAKETDTRGIKIKLAGRIDGNDIARKEGKRRGNLPLQRICAKIDYCSHKIQTIYGVLGLKIWIFKK